MKILELKNIQALTRGKKKLKRNKKECGPGKNILRNNG